MADQKKARKSFGEWLKYWMSDLIAIAVLLCIMFFICKGVPAIMNSSSSATDTETTTTAAIITMADTDAGLLA